MAISWFQKCIQLFVGNTYAKHNSWILDLNNIQYYRYQLTHENCPPRLIQKLRCLSTCVCEKTTIPNRMAQYYVAMNGIKFATSYWLHPQKTDSYKTSNYIYLQYHFCEFFNKCKSKKFRMLQSSRNRFRLNY